MMAEKILDASAQLIEKGLQETINKTIGNLFENNKHIFEIYNQIATEIELLNKKHAEIKDTLAVLIPEVDLARRKEKITRQALASASASSDAYMSALEAKQELREKEEEEQSLRKERDDIEFRIARFEEMERRIRKASVAIGSVATFLQSHISDLSSNIAELKDRTNIDEKIILAHEYERQRISRELHDTVAQDLAYLKTEASSCEYAIQKNKLDLALEIISIVKNKLSDCLTGVRQSIFDMRPMSIDDQGLLGAIHELCVSTEKKYHINIYFEIENRDKFSDILEYKKIAVYRIVQEALTNIVHHANATKVIVKCVIASHVLSIFVKDNGSGFDSEHLLNVSLKDKTYDHFGIMGAIGRAKHIGAELSIVSHIGAGATIRLRIPF